MKKNIYNNDNHSSKANLIMDLGIAYYSLGNYEKAIKYHDESLKMRKIIYSKNNHPDIARSLNNLGNASHLQENEKAIKYY